MKFIFRISLILIIILSSCRTPDNYFQGNVLLRFSQDTVVFDTIFTTVGSITKRLKVYNDLNEDLLINEIKLAGMGNSPFRLNIDGLQSNIIHEVVLRANDSLHIFIEVTIDPNNVNDPLIHIDSILFNTNGNLQDVDLTAWGQDAYFYYENSYTVYENNDSSLPNDTLFYYSIQTPTTWSNEKPHVIYGNVIIHEGGTLDILAGTEIYLHHNSNIIVLESSRINILGEISLPVLITGDRLDEYYKDLPGQWGRIWITDGSSNNTIQNATIKNGTIGLHVDTIANSFETTLNIENTMISNHSSFGILAYSSRIEANNCQFNDNGIHDLYLFAGGNYRFSHCTFANYTPSHQSSSILMSNFYQDINGNEILRPMEQANFENCIVYGNMESEIAFQESENTQFNYQFNHCLIKLKESDYDTTNNSHFQNNEYNASPQFLNPYEAYEYNYELDSLSPAKNTAAQNIALQFPYDFYGNSRINDQGPDKGAFEFID